jgi:hypothetical protein
VNRIPKYSGRAAEGGCRCGSVAFRARTEPTVVVYCHCRDCRRSSGAPISLWVGYRSERVELTRGEPTVYESSPGVRSSFCGTCGSPISFEDERLPGETYLPGACAMTRRLSILRRTTGCPGGCSGSTSRTGCPATKKAAS